MCITGNHIVDSIRYIQLGKSSVNLRKCTRCGNFTTVNSIARTPAMIAWVKRWKQKCRCGGFWELEKV